MYALLAIAPHQELRIPASAHALQIGAVDYSARVRRGTVTLLFLIVLSAASNGFPAEPNWAGDYADNNFLNGQAAFQLSIEPSGEAIQVSFDAAYTDAHGTAPDGNGIAKITRKNTLEFQWEDSFKNSGAGKIVRSGDGIKVSMKTSRVVDSRCLVFYGQNMRLKRVKK